MGHLDVLCAGRQRLGCLRAALDALGDRVGTEFRVNEMICRLAELAGHKRSTIAWAWWSCSRTTRRTTFVQRIPLTDAGTGQAIEASQHRRRSTSPRATSRAMPTSPSRAYGKLCGDLAVLQSGRKRWGVYARHFDPTGAQVAWDGGARTAPRPVIGTAISSNAKITALADGRSVATWQSYGGTQGDGTTASTRVTSARTARRLTSRRRRRRCKAAPSFSSTITARPVTSQRSVDRRAGQRKLRSDVDQREWPDGSSYGRLLEVAQSERRRLADGHRRRRAASIPTSAVKPEQRNRRGRSPRRLRGRMAGGWRCRRQQLWHFGQCFNANGTPDGGEFLINARVAAARYAILRSRR